MKKLLILFLLFPSLAWGGESVEIARMNPYVLGAGVAAAAKSCLSDSASLIDNLPDQDDYIGIIGTGIVTNYGPFGQRYTPSVATRICSVSFDIRFCYGSGATYLVEIYDISGSTTLGASPASGCSSGTIALTEDNDMQAHKFTGLNCALSASTEYAIVLTTNNGDADNHCQAFYGNTNVISGNYARWKSDKTFYDNRATWDMSIELFGFAE